MILEVAILDVISGKESDFQRSFAEGVHKSQAQTLSRKAFPIHSPSELGNT